MTVEDETKVPSYLTNILPPPTGQKVGVKKFFLRAVSPTF